MARVSIPSKDRVSDELKDVFQNMERRGGQVLNIFKVMAHCPRVGREFLRLGNAILFNGSLPPKLRELAILRVGDLDLAPQDWCRAGTRTDEEDSPTSCGRFFLTYYFLFCIFNSSRSKFLSLFLTHPEASSYHLSLWPM